MELAAPSVEPGWAVYEDEGMRRFKLVFLALIGLAAPAAAQEDYRHGRIRYLEPGVTLQRATETSAEEAVINLPYLPGDRVWTDASGRAEFQFESGALLRLDSRSKLDYTAHDEGRNGRVVLRLWSGGLYLRVRNRGDEGFVFETPVGLIEIEKRGVYRIDSESGEVRLSVYEGEAKLEAGGERVDVNTGERAYARHGESVEPPARFDRGEDDEFARWDEDRERREAWAAGSRKYLPDELDTYASEFESNGTWYYEGDVGYVWRPTVAVGWRPYWNGRWVWTAYGWTWTPYEPWGWAPFHYGRWGYTGALGWYWMPGRVWGPGWVSWAVAGDYVGWCPLGYRDRPVYWSPGRGHGYAVPRGQGGEASSPWAFVKRGEVGARDVAVRRVDLRPENLGDVRISESPRVRLSRDARELKDGPVSREVAVPRASRARPTPADSVPELGPDRQPTIPNPWTTRRRPTTPREDPSRYDRQPAPDEPVVPRAPRDPEATDRGGDRPTDTRSPRRGPESTGAVPRQGSQREGSARPDPDARNERDREVLRPLFQPLSEPRSKREEARPRDEGRPRDDGRPREGARPRDEGRSRESGGGGGGSRGREAGPPPKPERQPPPPAAPPAPRQERANPPPPRQDDSRSDSGRSSSPPRSPEQAHARRGRQ
jgi:FecR protein